MPYPGKPLSDYERAFEMGRPIEAPAMPTPDILKAPNIQGGAPKLGVVGSDGATKFFDQKTPGLPAKPSVVKPPEVAIEPRYTTPAFPAQPTPGPGPYWERTPLPEAPQRHTLYPAVPWDRKEIETQWGDYIKQLGESIWERYQKLPPEQKALASWQQVAKNPQEAAYSIVARTLANTAKLKSGLTPQGAANTQNSGLFRWLRSVGR